MKKKLYLTDSSLSLSRGGKGWLVKPSAQFVLQHHLHMCAHSFHYRDPVTSHQPQGEVGIHLAAASEDEAQQDAFILKGNVDRCRIRLHVLISVLFWGESSIEL